MLSGTSLRAVDRVVCLWKLCSYLNTEIVKKSRQCRVDSDFYQIGIEYEGCHTQIREVIVCFEMRDEILISFLYSKKFSEIC